MTTTKTPRRKKSKTAPIPAPAAVETPPTPHPGLVLVVQCDHGDGKSKTYRHMGVHSFTMGDEGILRLFSADGGAPVCVYNSDDWSKVEWVPLATMPQGSK